MARHLPSSRMMIGFFPSRIPWLALMLVAGACDRSEPVRTRDDIAADSALAADLALANRDTLLIDSIGQYQPVAAAVSDTGASAAAMIVPAPVAAPPAARAVPPAATPTAPPASPPRTADLPAPPRSAKTAAPRRRTSGDPCNSPRLADQQECVRINLAAADRRLNGVYRALLTEMRRQEGIRGGQKDPPSVARLRVAQRAWVVHRDTECRRRGRGTEGPLWARPRVRCLGEFSVRRANELADNFSRLTAR